MKELQLEIKKVFGDQDIEKLISELKEQKINSLLMVFSNDGLLRDPLIEDIKKAMQDNKMEFKTYTGLDKNSLDKEINEAIEVANTFKPQLVLSLGKDAKNNEPAKKLADKLGTEMLFAVVETAKPEDKKKNRYTATIDEYRKRAYATDPRESVANYEPVLEQSLETFKDLKLGVLVCYGLYSEAGTMESWLMCKQPSWNWARTMDPRFEKDHGGDYDSYVNWYLGLAKTINPHKFDANEWMDVMDEAGVKYFGFTSRHHDGFTLFDTKYSDFKITADGSKRKVDMLKELFDAAEKRDIKKWLYYSPADWTHEAWSGPYYYDKTDSFLDHDNQEPVDPVKWERFTEYFENQVKELLTNYGKIDCIWLDSNWLRPDNGYDLHMDKVAPMMREMQPGLIVVDRGDDRNEDYWTPENTLISEPVTNIPWESTITLGGHWGWTAWDELKNEHWVIDSLLNNISNGGNLNLGLGPKGDGSLPKEMIRILNAVGRFTKMNGKGIYASRAIAPYHTENAYFTSSKDKKQIFAFITNESKTFEIPKEFKGFKHVEAANGNKLNVENNNVNLSNYKSDEFEYKMITFVM